MDVIAFRDELRSRLIAQRGKFRQIRNASGLTDSWLSKFANAAIQNPTISKLDRLAKALDDIDRPEVA